VLSNLTRWAEADSVGRLVAARRARLSAYEQAYLDVLLATVRGDDEAHYRAAVAMQRAAPKSAFAAYYRGVAAMTSGRQHEADSVLGALDPSGGALRGRIFYFQNYGAALHALGAYDRQLSLAQRAQRQYPGRLIPFVPEVEALAALGRGRELLARLDVAASMRPDADRTSPVGVMTVAIHELRFHGHADLVPAVRSRLLAWLDAHPPGPGDDVARRDAAWALLAAEQWDRLPPLADSLAAGSAADPETLGLRGVVLAMRGDRAGAARVDAQLVAQRSPYYRRARLVARAGIAAALGDRPGAFARFREAYGPGTLESSYAHGAWLFDRLRDYPPFLAYLVPQG
jgi:tetratricopeptide (TPR) repeat protein